MVKILITGSSIASEEFYYGYDRWPTLLRKSLEEDSGIYNVAISGATTKHLLDRSEVEFKHRASDIIIIYIGTNDSRYNYKTLKSVETSKEMFEKNMKKLIKLAEKYTKKVVILGSLPCNELKTTPTIWSETEYFTNRSIGDYNKIKELVCKEENILFLNLFREFNNLNYKELLEEKDGLHPNRKGHQKIFELVRKFLEDNKLI